MAADFVARFADFDGGDFGVKDPAKTQTNQFTGSNVVIYDSGLVGPRPGIKPFPVTGLPDYSTLPSPAGFDVWEDHLVIGVDDALYKIPINDPSPAAVKMDDYADDPTPGMCFAHVGKDLWVTNNGKLYRHEYGTTDSTAITLPASVELDGIVRWGYRLIGWDKAVPYRLYYSTVSTSGAEWDDWDTNGFIDVPGQEAVTALIPWYNALLIGRKTGWWQLSGVVDTNPFLRELSQGNGPVDRQQAVRTTDNRAFYWSAERTPVWFNGENTFHADDYRINKLDVEFPCQSVIAAPSGRKLFMLGEPAGSSGAQGTSLLVNRDRRWSGHSFNDPIGGLAPSSVEGGADIPDGTLFGVMQPSSVPSPPELFTWDTTVYRPGHDDDDWVAPKDMAEEDLVTGVFETPAWYDSQSRMVQVRAVVIQFRKWPSGIFEDINELSVSVRALGKYQGGNQQSIPYTWSEPADRPDPNGTDDSWRVGMGDQGWSGGFQISIDKMRGVAIRSIEVHCELRGANL